MSLYFEEEWRRVSEYLPPKSGSYIICTKNGAVCTAHFYERDGKFSSPAGKNAEFWMFLPESPIKRVLHK